VRRRPVILVRDGVRGHAERVTARRRPHVGGLRLRSVLLLGMVIPLLGVTGVAARAVAGRLDRRDASAALRDETEELRQIVGDRAAYADEEIRSTAVALAHDVGVTQDELGGVGDGDLVAQLEAARRAVDASRTAEAPAALADALADLDDLRASLDAGRAGHRDVVDTFVSLNGALNDQVGRKLRRIERIADREPLPGDVRARLRTLRASVLAFEQGAPRVNTALEILLEAPTPELLATLVRADARFDVAVEQADPVPGTEAARAWRALQEDPAVERTEATLALAVAVGSGQTPPWQETDIGLVIAGVGDGARWGERLIGLVQASALDLSESADGHAEADAARVRTEVLRTAALLVASVAVALLTARALARPAADLEAAARRVEQGEFDTQPVPVRGPREVSATVSAFNDMAATLAAVEDHAVALAEDPASPLLDEALPGRTGQAMQAAIDRLRRSLDEAEAHRAELAQLASHDGLTGLLNRTAAYLQIERELARAQRQGESLLAVYVDLDGLKQLNDTYGHHVGDAAIVRTAEALHATTRRADVVARVGGDEFMVVGAVPSGGPEAVVAFAERLHDAVAEQTVPLPDGTDRPLRCSVGVALSDTAGDTTEDLVRAADAAMYRAKAGGRGGVVASGLGPTGTTAV